MTIFFWLPVRFIKVNFVHQAKSSRQQFWALCLGSVLAKLRNLTKNTPDFGRLDNLQKSISFAKGIKHSHNLIASTHAEKHTI